MNNKTIHVPHIYIPKKGIDLTKYAVIACDQFTSQIDYWEKVKSLVGDNVSTYHMIFPEAYLGKVDEKKYIEGINNNINTYLNDGSLIDIGEYFILVERTTSFGIRRLGLVLSIDLEDYSYNLKDNAKIRASEATIVERIPPRLKIRKDAPLELPHTLLLYDDKNKQIIEKLYQNRTNLEKIYDFDLNMDGGHIRGYRVDNVNEIIEQFEDLYAKNNNGIMFVVGDGNHSLATAKAHWNIVKEHLSEKDRLNHPARFALVEVNNLYDDGIIFEPIHRIIFNASNDFADKLIQAMEGNYLSRVHLSSGFSLDLHIPKNGPEAYLMVQTYLDEYLKEHLESSIDFIHDEDQLIEVCEQNDKSVAIIMPSLTKDDIFTYLSLGRVLPRKSFSMGHASEKRYYFESKKIIKK